MCGLRLHNNILDAILLPSCESCPHITLFQHLHARAGNDFFRVAHSVSFANTGSFDKTRTASNASAAHLGAAAGMPDSAKGSGGGLHLNPNSDPNLDSDPTNTPTPTPTTNPNPNPDPYQAA